MKKSEVSEVTTTQTQAANVLENKLSDSLQEIIRRMNASAQKNEVDPVIYRKLAQLSKN